MQLRYPTRLTGEHYVDVRAWRDARLERCPNHPHGRCSFARHGTYTRKTPRGTRIARWYCPESHTTFSLLPDCLAAHLPDTLDALETVVDCAERASSIKAAATELRRDFIELPGAPTLGPAPRAACRSLPDCCRQIPTRTTRPLRFQRRRTSHTPQDPESAYRVARTGCVEAVGAAGARWGSLQKGVHSVSRKFDVQHKMGHDPPSFGA